MRQRRRGAAEALAAVRLLLRPVLDGSGVAVAAAVLPLRLVMVLDQAAEMESGAGGRGRSHDERCYQQRHYPGLKEAPTQHSLFPQPYQDTKMA